MDSLQKRDRDRRKLQKRKEKQVRRIERAETKQRQADAASGQHAPDDTPFKALQVGPAMGAGPEVPLP